MAVYVEIKTILDELRALDDICEDIRRTVKPVDVVERSKINKAIKEIEDLNYIGNGFEIYYECMNQVLEIIKRNIEE